MIPLTPELVAALALYRECQEPYDSLTFIDLARNLAEIVSDLEAVA